MKKTDCGKSFLLGLFILLFFASCKNFIDSTDIVAKLDEALAYVNSSFVSVTITSPNSTTESIIPAAGEYIEKYKKSDSFTVKFTPTEYYIFKYWQVTPEDAVKIDNPKSSETTFTILSDSEPIEIKPVCGSIPKVIQYTPTYDSIGVNCGSLIKIFFDEPIDDPSNIYWTYDELVELGHTPNSASVVASFFDEKSGSFTDLTIDGKPVDPDKKWDEIKKQYYYFGYEENNKLIMKNIEVSVNNKGQEQSLLTLYRFMSPYFENQNVLVIPPRKNKSYMGVFEGLPANSNISVTISSKMKSVKGENLKEDYSFYYRTSSEYDVNPPSGNITSILGYTTIVPFYKMTNTKKDTKILQETEIKRLHENIGEYNRDKELETIQKASTVDELLDFGLKPVKHLAFIGPDTIKEDDEGRELRSLTLELVPVTCKAYENEKTETLSKTKNYYGKKSVVLSNPDESLLFDFPEDAKNGVYRIYLYATDIFGNTREIPVYIAAGNSGISPQYCIYDNTMNEKITEIEPDGWYSVGSANKKCTFVLPKGKYLFISEPAPTYSRGGISIAEIQEIYETVYMTGVYKSTYTRLVAKETAFNYKFTTVTEDNTTVSFDKYLQPLEYYICTEDKLGNFYVMVYDHISGNTYGYTVSKYFNGKKI